jgi:hypothetical protein
MIQDEGSVGSIPWMAVVVGVGVGVVALARGSEEEGAKPGAAEHPAIIMATTMSAPPLTTDRTEPRI